MMTAAFTINNGPLLDVEAYGVELLTYSQSNQAEGQMQVTVIRRPDDPFLFSLNDSVTIYINGVRYFTGLADQGTMLASSTDYRHAHILRDPWTVLENCQWRGHGPPLPAQEAYSSGGWYMLREWQKANLSQYFIMPGWPNSVPQVGYGYWPNVTGPLAVSVTRLLKPNILVAQSWDHSTLPPTMVIRNQGDLVVNLEKEKNGVGDDIVLTRRDDLKPSCVEIVGSTSGDDYLGQQQTIGPYLNEDTFYLYPPEAAPGSYGGVLILDPPLSRDQVQNGAAQFIYNLLSVPVWEGSFTVQTYIDGGTPLRLSPGMTVNLSGPGYNPDWATMNAVIQAVELDMKSGKATVHVGASGHAALTDIMERSRDVLSMRHYNAMRPTTPYANTAVTTVLGPASGTSASAIASVATFNTASITVNVTISVQMGSGNFTSGSFVDVFFPINLGSAYSITVSLGSNASASALHPVITWVNARQLRLSKGTMSPVADSYCQWILILNKPPG